MTSIRHKIATNSSELKKSIRKVALQGLMNREGGIIGTERKIGRASCRERV